LTTEYKSIFISDVHLGTSDSQAEYLLEFFKKNESQNLYLVGDIIDGWALKRKFNWKQSHSDVVQKILRKARKGTKVYYVLGNHDEFIRGFLPLALGDNIVIDNEFDYIDSNNNRFLVTHGDFFDSITMTKKWLAHLGDKAYLFMLKLNKPLNGIRKFFGYHKYWSLSKYMKENVKKSVMFITDYEHILSTEAKTREYDGVICGHIHQAEIKDIDGLAYLNCGDWVESNTAIVETNDGEWKLIKFFED
jgi:UDP-2,3-diacylglucosamine pyrophosphatase LpxH